MSSSKYVILGGGMVAGYAAKELVDRGLRSGELTIISADDAVPYERPPLSKSFLSGKDTEAGILINGPDWYREKGIEIKLQTVIENVDLAKKHLLTSSSQDFEFESLLIATGCRVDDLSRRAMIWRTYSTSVLWTIRARYAHALQPRSKR